MRRLLDLFFQRDETVPVYKDLAGLTRMCEWLLEKRSFEKYFLDENTIKQKS